MQLIINYSSSICSKLQVNYEIKTVKVNYELQILQKSYFILKEKGKLSIANLQVGFNLKKDL